eukprot:TRINITY_DN1253_c0_g1_i13.p1 TRINITY_DN1253_c0_g1~~TRINITY_DN1253_c0_g1_i13.p1  ORF type:complete len:475 (-),score=119.79 TRINITY_DN1253_c0_g1_i13:267-1595(-)
MLRSLVGSEMCIRDRGLESVDNIVGECMKNVPGWSDFDPSSITIKQLCEGLSNQAYAVSVSDAISPKTGQRVAQRVLFRVYGKQVSKLYDPKAELHIFDTLSKYRIAPELIGTGDGWRIEEWHYAVAVPCALMNNSSILCQVASNLGRMHKLHRRQDFPNDIPRDPVMELRLKKWGKGALEISESCTSDMVKGMGLERVVSEEVPWLTHWLLSHASSVSGQGLDVVFCHNDLQENNLLQTQYGLRMIDFEYSAFNYQACDIANYFCEFTMDYVSETSYPFYLVDKTAFPGLDDQRLFCAVYLSEYLETPIRISDSAYIQPLLQNVERFTMVSHLTWALWSIVRAEGDEALNSMPNFNEFNFSLYGKHRLDMYFRTKADLTAKEDATQQMTMTNDQEALRARVEALEQTAKGVTQPAAVLGISTIVCALALVGTYFGTRQLRK